MQKRYGRVLVVDDNEDVLTAARILLKHHVEAVETTNDPEQLPEILDRQRFDVILLDMNFHKDVTSGEEGFYWLRRISESIISFERGSSQIGFSSLFPTTSIS